MRVQIGDLIIEENRVLFEETDRDGYRKDSYNSLTIENLKAIILGGKDWTDERIKLLNENHHKEILSRNEVIKKIETEKWKLQRENESLSKKLMSKVLKME